MAPQNAVLPGVGRWTRAGFERGGGAVMEADSMRMWEGFTNITLLDKPGPEGVEGTKKSLWPGVWKKKMP